MWDDLMCQFAVVLQEVVFLQLLSGGDPFAVLEHLDEMVVGCEAICSLFISQLCSL